jgi:adenylosuccinate lyase
MINFGGPVGHTIIAFNSILKCLNRLIVNGERINSDLDNNWAVVAEALQTILRREGYHKPYEALLDLTRTNQKITKESIVAFIENLDVSESLKSELKAVTPFNFTGF